jgi:hypothetical protein
MLFCVSLTMGRQGIGDHSNNEGTKWSRNSEQGSGLSFTRMRGQVSLLCAVRYGIHLQGTGGVSKHHTRWVWEICNLSLFQNYVSKQRYVDEESLYILQIGWQLQRQISVRIDTSATWILLHPQPSPLNISTAIWSLVALRGILLRKTEGEATLKCVRY